MKTAFLLLLATLSGAAAAQPAVTQAKPSDKPPALTLVFQPEGDRESAPHGAGNIYAPHVLLDHGVFCMWYGAQGKDGHDRICLATSPDGQHWTRKGVVLEDPTANHVNDPTVVKVDHTWFMFFTRAGRGVVDEIDCATSQDAEHWQLKGPVLSPGHPGEWDALSVGRPSVIVDEGIFKMWYDGRKDLPLGAPSPGVPKSPDSTRSVGYATSKDGLTWTRHSPNPVFGHNAGGVDVTKVGGKYLMTYESPAGTQIAASPDGIAWQDHGLWIPHSGNALDAFGHVTPHLLIDSDHRRATLFVGAARAATWDHNTIASIPIPYIDIEALQP